MTDEELDLIESERLLKSLERRYQHFVYGYYHQDNSSEEPIGAKIQGKTSHISHLIMYLQYMLFDDIREKEEEEPE